MEQILLSLFTFFAGLLIGHRLSLGRDKRKEFNEVVQRVRPVILAISKNPSPYNNSINDEDMRFLITGITPWKRRKFRKAWEHYNRARGSVTMLRDGAGGVFYSDEDMLTIKVAATNVLPFVERM